VGQQLSELEGDEFFEETFRRLGEDPDYKALRKQTTEAYEVRSKYSAKLNTRGWVWVYLRKPRS
jgi:hypothetical protein